MIFDREYFDKAFAREGGWGYAVSEYERVKYVRQLEVIRQFAPRPDNILEVGCAEGLFSRMLAEAFPQAEICCVDISPVALEKARERCCASTNTQFIEGDVIELLRRRGLPMNSYDVLIQSESLYYLFPKLATQGLLFKYLANMVGTLRPDGVFVTANGLSLVTRGVMGIYYLALGRLCNGLYRASYREWNEFRRKRFTYELRVYRKQLPS